MLIKRAISDLETAKAITFKAYASHRVTLQLGASLIFLGDALVSLSKTKIKQKDNGNHTSEQATKIPANGTESQVKKQETETWLNEKDIERRFKSVVCEQLGVNSEQCRSDANFVEDLGADEFDPSELLISMEEEFSILFTEDEASHVKTYGDLLNLVKSKILDQ